MATKTIKSVKFVDGKPTDQAEDFVVEDNGLQWGAKDKHKYVNTKVPRVDAPYKTTGTARYTLDVRLDGMLHGRFVTSTVALGTIATLDIAPAQAIAGVKSVVAILNIGGQVRYEGQPVVAIAATTPEISEDAARAVVVTYNRQQHVVTGDDALKALPAGGARGGGGGGGGRGPGGAGGNEAAVDAALQTADGVVEAEYRTPTLHHCCLETHCAVADFRGGATATCYVSTQGTFTIPAEAARELGLGGAGGAAGGGGGRRGGGGGGPSPVTGIVENMGGGFGSKLQGIGIVGQWACRLAKLNNVPVKMAFNRREEFLTAGNGPGSIQRFRAGAMKDGTLVAMNVTQYSLPGLNGGGVAQQPYQYRVRNNLVFRQASNLNTNIDSAVPLRAPGHPQACFAMESLMDELAYKIGMDPVEFRKKNVPADANGTAWIRQLDTGAKAIGWANRNMTPGKGTGNLLRGMGCAIGAWAGGGRGGSIVDVVIAQDGSVTVTSGAQDLGTGTRTYIRSIVAEELGLDLSQVVEKIGDSNYGNAPGSGGSATAASVSPAVKHAGYLARTGLFALVAPLLGTGPESIWVKDGYVVGNGKAITWKQACMAVPAAGLRVQGQFQQGLSGQGAHGASFAEVEVDMETGHVRVTKMAHVQDGGLILNRLAVESQINGGMIQSIGMALYEGRIMDATRGVMVNPSFLDYKLPGCTEIPELIPIIDDGDTRNVVMGIAEPANIPGCGAIANAVYNACGVRVRETPITPDKILNGLIAQKKQA